MTFHTLKAALLGCNIAHSLSPVLHKAAAESLGFEADYLLLETEPAALEATIVHAAETLDGFNVTAPHKSAVYSILSTENHSSFTSSLDLTAQKAGAVNTVQILRKESNIKPHLRGYNTDLEGVRAAIDFLSPFCDSRAILLGAGGAARAVLTALTERPWELTVLARRKEAATELAQTFGAQYNSAELFSFSDYASNTALLINTLPPAADETLTMLNLSLLPSNAAVLDLGYGPRPLLQHAQKLGLRTCDGLRFLLAQGISAFKLWTGLSPDCDATWHALQNAQQARLSKKN